MPEGDTIFRAARTLHRVLAGKAVTRFESVLPALTRIAEDRPIVGRTIDSVTARGKHLLMAFSGGLTLRTHMRMNGSWHVYPSGARWHRPARDMRVLIATADAVAVGFNVPVAEWLTARDLTRHRVLNALGPDLLAPTFDTSEALQRIRAHQDAEIGNVLLDQRVLSGIGNVFKAEVLFTAGIDPFAIVGALTDDELAYVLDVARAQLRANVLDRDQTLNVAFGRRTTRSVNPGAKLWVYGRSRQPCRRCGTHIRAVKRGPDARLTYWCPRCQPRRT